jgi:hypothetical protein
VSPRGRGCRADNIYRLNNLSKPRMDKAQNVDSKFYVQSINRALAILAEVSKEYERGLKANGKCLICELSDKKIQELLSIKGLPALTSQSITDLPDFLFIY